MLNQIAVAVILQVALFALLVCLFALHGKVPFWAVMKSFRACPWPLLLVICCSVFCCACGPVAGFFAVAQAIIATAGVVLKFLANVLTPTEEAEAQGLVGTVSTDLTLVENEINTYESNKTGTGLLAAVQAGIATLSGSLGALESAAGIKNSTLLNWIGTIVAAVQAGIQEVVTVILPLVPSAIAAHVAGDSTQMENIGVALKGATAKMIVLHNAGAVKYLDAATAKTVIGHVHNAAEPHLGKIRL